MALTPRFDPGPHSWEASALITVPSLAPQKRHCYQITSPPRMMSRFDTKIVKVIMQRTGEMVMVKYGKL